MTVDERLDQLMPDIMLGLITDIEVNKRMPIMQILTHERPRKRTFYLIVDLFYRRFVSFNETTKPKVVVEVFNQPEFVNAYEIRKNIFLHKSRNVRLVEHWNNKTLSGKSKPRPQYREGLKNGSNLSISFTRPEHKKRIHTRRGI